MDNSGRKVDFGYEKVAWGDKAQRVHSVFASVAGKYDVMNDLMSFGVHRLWKQFTLSLTGLRPGQRALDVAGGTGDLAAGMLRQVGKSGRVVLSDVNAAMLEIGRDRLLDQGFSGNVECTIADAENLPFKDNSFDCVTIGFGLRNVTDKVAALKSMHRVLKTGGQLLVLEFSTPTLRASSRFTTFIPSKSCRCWAGWLPGTRRATGIWRNRSACIPIKRLCSRCCAPRASAKRVITI
jgi:demethylmenaquinone methyltransferase/2-methoxy-6-polyprenyl-1,4-benzoquinol methylase